MTTPVDRGNESPDRTVLLVDDDRELLDSLVRGLRKHPWRVLTASSAAAALALLDEEEVTVVVSDEHMPGRSGAEFLSLLRERSPDVIRIILTGRPSIDTVYRAHADAEVHLHITKPCDVDVLVEKMERLRSERSGPG